MKATNKLTEEQFAKLQEQMKMLGLQLEYTDKQETNTDWKNDLQTSKYGYLSSISNYKLWLQNGSERYTNRLKYNEFFDFVEYNGKMIDDVEEDYLYESAEHFFEHTISRQNLKTAFNTYVYDNRYNPITDYLDTLKNKWDNKPRLETFIIECLDAEDNSLNRFFTKTWMIAAVKRAYEPGCQFDCVLALQGGVQGSGKTSLIRRIALDKYYKTFSSDEFKSKDCIDKMNKSWITVLDEFDKYNDKEVADLKCKITETTMSCRKSYGHNTTDYKVHWVYAATTNADDFLCDLTGDEYERRYWIIECNKTTVDSRVNDTLTDEYVEQLWAEAVHYYFEDTKQKLYLASNNPLFDAYKVYQRKFKKTANNTAIDYINEILNKEYSVDSNGYFNDCMDMYNQYTQQNLYEHCVPINKVPLSYVRHILKRVYGVDYAPKTIKSMLMQNDCGWYLKQSSLRYKGKVMNNVLVRNVPIEANTQNSDMTELPF